jgi:hypothetical protein
MGVVFLRGIVWRKGNEGPSQASLATLADSASTQPELPPLRRLGKLSAGEDWLLQRSSYAWSAYCSAPTTRLSRLDRLCPPPRCFRPDVRSLVPWQT